MDRIERLSINPPQTELFICSKCTGTTSVSESEICDFCWYDFEATEDERGIINQSNLFRELSVHQWYEKLHVTKLQLSLLSPITIMHILHDCFRSSFQRLAFDYCLQAGMNIFPESITWLRRLIAGLLPVLTRSTSNERIYKFAAGIGRTPIWYKVIKNEIDLTIKWLWTPYNPMQDINTSTWIQCPQLLVSEGLYTDQVPVSDNIFIIMFLHTFRPDPPSQDFDRKLNPNQLIKNYIREDILKTHPDFIFRMDKS